jgi:hypothetical protein
MNDRGGSVVLTTRHPLSTKLALALLINGGRSVGTVRLRTKATVFGFTTYQFYLKQFCTIVWHKLSEIKINATFEYAAICESVVSLRRKTEKNEFKKVHVHQSTI